jgi:ubiquinone/menaquinone biosynthesis C-methylase UbiE
MKKDTSWGGVAEWYRDLLFSDKPSYQKDVILPNLLRLMALEKGETVLDLACGPGFFSRAFAAAGAKVVGADISEELIAMAREHVKGADFHVASARRLPFVGDASVDAVAIVLAIQNIEGVKDVFAECRRVLKPMGRLYVVMNHPAFRVPGESDWGWDAKAKRQYRRVDRYLGVFPATIRMHPAAAPAEETISFHRPLQEYFKALSKNGLCVRRLEEWISDRTSSSGPRSAAENAARKEFPLFLCLEAIREK